MTRAIVALLLLCSLSLPTPADDTKPMRTILIVARGDLPDPNFKDSIVLVMNHIGPAPAGVILNRPTHVAVSRLFPDVERLAALEDKIYFGGPVDIEAVSFLFRADERPDNATEVLDGIYLSTSRELLRELLARDKPMDGLKIFVGYSGWARGQLENEIARGDWTLEPADASAIFDNKSERPWPERSPARGQRTSVQKWQDGAPQRADDGRSRYPVG
jgi:putative transcriptional regulator